MTTKKFGRYEILDELGKGGMATVYRALDPRFGRDVALKVLPPQFLHDPMFRGRFEREAKTIAMLEHAAIVPVYDFGEESGQPYLVMRLMNGGTLADRLKNGPMELEDALAILQRIGSALDEAHKQNIVHRDLKPANILFDHNNNAFLSDFGIVKLSESTMTGTSMIGTPAYMSPEQARGDANIDGRSDIYALGVIFYEMLTGTQPYHSDTPMGVAVMHVTAPVPRLLDANPNVDNQCEKIVQHAMAKQPNERYPTAGNLVADLNTLVVNKTAARAAQAVATPQTDATKVDPVVPAPVAAPQMTYQGTEVIGPPTPPVIMPERPATVAEPEPAGGGRSRLLWVAIVVVVLCIGVTVVLGGGFGVLSMLSGDDSPTRTVPRPTPTTAVVDQTGDDGQQTVDTPQDTPGAATASSLEQTQAATVQIVVQGSQFLEEFIGSGSGVIYDASGLVVTNYHVVEGAAIVQVYVEGHNVPIAARVLGKSPCDDLAVLQLATSGNYPIAILGGDGTIGDTVFAIGYPLGDPTQSLTRGIISKVDLEIATAWAYFESATQTDAAINPGNSGGPLVSEDGVVIGINSAGLNSAQGTNFAIGMNYARPIIERLASGENINWIGINAAPLPADLAQEYGLADVAGLFVYAVDSGSPADNAGVSEGDFILMMEGVALGTDGTVSQLCSILNSHTPGDVLDLTVLRDGTEMAGQINGQPLQ